MIAVFTMMLMVTAAFTGASQAASFDCAKAVSKTEKMICSTPALSKADEVMAAAYKTAIGLASRFAPDDTKGIKEDQVAWLRERQRSCEDRPCLVDAYKERNEAFGFLCGAGQPQSRQCRRFHRNLSDGAKRHAGIHQL